MTRAYMGGKATTYMTANADRPIPIAEATEAIGWRQDSLSAHFGKLLLQFPQNFERLSRGTYIWHSQARIIPSNVRGPAVDTETPPEPAPKQETPETAIPREFIVQVLSENDGKTLVRAEDTGKLYMLTDFTL